MPRSCNAHDKDALIQARVVVVVALGRLHHTKPWESISRKGTGEKHTRCNKGAALNATIRRKWSRKVGKRETADGVSLGLLGGETQPWQD